MDDTNPIRRKLHNVESNRATSVALFCFVFPPFLNKLSLSPLTTEKMTLPFLNRRENKMIGVNDVLGGKGKKGGKQTALFFHGQCRHMHSGSVRKQTFLVEDNVCLNKTGNVEHCAALGEVGFFLFTAGEMKVPVP